MEAGAGVKYIGYNTPVHKKVINNFLARKKMARDEQRKKQGSGMEELRGYFHRVHA